MPEVQKIVFDHTKDRLLEAINIDNVDMDIIMSITKDMMHNFNRYDTQSEVIESIYRLLNRNDLPRIYTAIVLYQIIDFVMKHHKMEE
jgi:hypothetical protein